MSKYVVMIRDGRPGNTHGFSEKRYIVQADSPEEALLKVATFLHNLPRMYRLSNITQIEIDHAENLSDATKWLGVKGAPK